MEPTTTLDTDTLDHSTAIDNSVDTATDAALVEDDLLVEEISIDGMCGVY